MTNFPEEYFYLRVGSASQPLVLDVERSSTFFGFGSNVKEGSKTVIMSQKSEGDADASHQLWRHENGYLVNKHSNLYLEVDNGKVGNRLVLHHQKSGNNGANQRWNLTKDGHIALKSHPKYVIDAKSASEKSQVVLSDSSSKSFAKSNHAKWEIISLNKKRRNEGAIGIIRLELVEAKNLKSVDSFFAGGKSDPYVRVFHEGGQDIIAQTKFIDNNLNPVWNEVHYLPVKNIGDKFILDVMDFNAFTKDKPLGHYTFEVTKELIKEVSPGVYEGTPNGIDTWGNLSIQGKVHYKAKFFPLNLNVLPKPSPDFLANLKEKPFDKSTLYILITLQAPNGSFPPSDTLANLFGYPNSEALFNLFKLHSHDERVIKNTKETIWTTSMVLWFLRYLLKEHRSEWGGIYERSERYITKELSGDLEIEEIVIASGRKAVRERFDIKVVDDKQIITREHIKAADITRIVRHQTSTGAFQASDDLAKLLSFNSSGQLRTALTRHINSQSKNTKITNYETQVWVTILVLYYYRLVGVDHQNEWVESYLKSYRWLWGQFKGKEKIEEEAFKIIESFVKERYSVKEDVLELDKQFIKNVHDKLDSIRKGATLSRSVSGGAPAKKLYGVARIKIINAKNLMKADTWLGGGASDPYVKIIGLASNLEYGETRVVYNNINPEWNQIFYIPIYDLNDKFKIQVYDYNAFFKHTILGTYVLDLKDFIKSLSNGVVKGKQLDLECDLRPNKGKLHFIADFHSFSEEVTTTTTITTTTITIQHLYILITYQRANGGFELNDNLAKLFNFETKEELIKSFTAYIEKDNDDKVKALHADIWGAALVTAFLKCLLWEHRHEWMTTYTKAETYLSEVVTDIEIEERLYNFANRFVIERFKVSEWESEEQKKSLGVIVTSKKIIITRRTVNIRLVRRFLSYQNETGCFELNNHLAETLGFSSAEDAKKSLETHFSSYSKISKLDVNLHSSAIMVWFLRYVLVDFRGEWADKYQVTSTWISEQVKDKQIEEELLEAARSFVTKRFDVDEEALKEDESFKSTVTFRAENIPADVRKKIEEAEIMNETGSVLTDQVIGLLKIKVKSAKNLPKSSSWFTSSQPDPYVKILDVSGQEIVRTRTINETINPIWNEVHYVSIHSDKEKITFDILDENLFVSDKPLGTYVFDTAKLVKKNDDGSFDTSDVVRELFPLYIGKKSSGELEMEIQFVSTVFNWKETFVFKRETIDIKHIYIILSWRNTRGYFEYSDDVSHFFNYKSQEELKSDIVKLTAELQNVSESAISTALIITYLKVVCWKYRNEWEKVIANSEEWLSSEIDNIEQEDKLYEICEKFIIDKFQVKDLEEEQKIVLVSVKKRVIITRKIVNIRVVRRIRSYQTKEGSIPLNNKTAEYFGFDSTEEFTKQLQTYFKSERVKKVEHVWASACIIWYLRYVALDYRNDWLDVFDKTSEYLSAQCNDSELEDEVLECARKFISERCQVDKESIEADKSFAVAIQNKKEIIRQAKEQELLEAAKNERRVSVEKEQKTITVETVKKYISLSKGKGFTLNDDVAKELTFENSESLKTSIQKHFDSKLTSTLNVDVLTTAISLCYLRLVTTKYRSEWKSTYESSYKWLQEQIKDEEVERELLESAKRFVVIQYNVDNETIETDTKEFSVKPKPAPKPKPVIKPIVSESQREAILNVQTSTTVEKTQSIISKQQGDGCFKLSEEVSKKLEISEETLTETIHTYTTNETIRKLTTKSDVVSTALTICYLQTFANQHESHWKEQHEKARKYLIKQVGEENVEEILAISKKIVVERVTHRIIRKQQRSAIATIQTSTTIEKIKSILSSFKSDHFEWNKTISKKLDIVSDNFASTCESYAKTDELKQTIKNNPSVWYTAIQLHYLELSAPHHEQHYRTQYDTARKWLKSQIKDEKLEKEIWEASYKLCTERATQRVIVKKRRIALLHLQSKTTVETAKAIISKQKSEGSIEISEEITKNCGISSDSVLTTVQNYSTSESLKKVTDVNVWKTAISLVYLENYCTAHESTWKTHHEKARKFIK